MTSVFITSSGTDIGKTHVCCRLLERLTPRFRLRCIKPVVSGFDPESPDATDTARLLLAQGRPVNTETIEATSPWRFRQPLSADMAAVRENRAVPFTGLLEFCRQEPGDEITLIEGIGGVMAPIDERHTVLDWIAALDTRVLLVVGSYLGSLSHTLTAFEVLVRAGKPPVAIVISQSESEPVPTAETAARIARHCDGIPVVVVWRNDEQGTDTSLATVERQLLS